MSSRAPGSKFTGVCKFWNVPKGCGFLTADDEGPDLFVSQHDLITNDTRFRALLPGQRVECIFTLVADGKAIGKQVTGPNGVPLPSFKDMYTAKREIEASKPPDPNKNYGKVKWFNPQKNFGFIVPDSGGQEVFFHFSECLKAIVPMEGNQVEYHLKPDKNGSSKLIACKVKNKSLKHTARAPLQVGYPHPLAFHHSSPIPTMHPYGHPAMVAAYGKKTGVVKFFDDSKGYGFIIPDLGGRDVHVHKSNIFGGELSKDDPVEYQEELVNGKVQAVAVRKRNPHAHVHGHGSVHAHSSHTHHNNHSSISHGHQHQAHSDYSANKRQQRVVYDIPQQQAATSYGSHGQPAYNYQYFDPSALSSTGGATSNLY